MKKAEEPKDEIVLRAVSETITEKTITFNIDIKPKNWFHALLINNKIRPSKRYFEIKPQRVGNVYRIAGRAVSFDVGTLIDEDGKILETLDRIAVLMNLMNKYGKDIIYIVACILQNDNNEPSEKMLDIVRNEFEMHELLYVLRIGVANYNVNAFIHSIALITGVDALKVKASPVETGV